MPLCLPTILLKTRFWLRIVGDISAQSHDDRRRKPLSWVLYMPSFHDHRSPIVTDIRAIRCDFLFVVMQEAETSEQVPRRHEVRKSQLIKRWRCDRRSRHKAPYDYYTILYDCPRLEEESEHNRHKGTFRPLGHPDNWRFLIL